jgi:hypothetical protein
MLRREVSGRSRQHRAHRAQSFLGDEHENHIQAGGGQLKRSQAWIASVFQAVVLLSRDAGPQAHVALLQAKLPAAGSELVVYEAHVGTLGTGRCLE